MQADNTIKLHKPNTHYTRLGRKKLNFLKALDLGKIEQKISTQKPCRPTLLLHFFINILKQNLKITTK